MLFADPGQGGTYYTRHLNSQLGLDAENMYSFDFAQ
jgi:hypothetical protein